VGCVEKVQRRIDFLKFALNLLVLLPRDVSAQAREQFPLSRYEFCEQPDCVIEVIVFVTTHETIPKATLISGHAGRLATVWGTVLLIVGQKFGNRRQL
jgi:hypothetical protein